MPRDKKEIRESGPIHAFFRKAITDPTFKAALISDPEGTVESELGPGISNVIKQEVKDTVEKVVGLVPRERRGGMTQVVSRKEHEGCCFGEVTISVRPGHGNGGGNHGGCDTCEEVWDKLVELDCS